MIIYNREERKKRIKQIKGGRTRFGIRSESIVEILKFTTCFICKSAN